MFFVSLAINVILVCSMVLLFSRAKRVARREKLATFNACVDAITLGLTRDDEAKRIDLVVYGLSAICGKHDADEIKWRLVQASEVRRIRNDVAADLLGEYGKFAAVQVSSPMNYRNDVLDYIMHHEEGMPEPRDKYVDSTLAGIQFHLQYELTALYKRQLGGVKLWGGGTETPFRANL